MIDRRHKFSKHLHAGRNRRKKRWKLQREMHAGRRTDPSVSTVNTDSKQQTVLSFLRSKSAHEQGHQFATPKRVALLTSLGLHLAAALVGTLYIVNTVRVDDDVVIVDLMRTKTPRKQRRLPPREVKRTQLSSPKQIIAPPRPKLVTTGVNLPQSEAWFTLPGNKLSSVDTRKLSDGETGLNTEELNKKLFSKAHRAKIRSVNPNISPDQSSSSIFDKISHPNNLHEDLEPNLVTPPPVQSTGLMRRPSWRRKIEPKYPDLARRAQKEGVVVVEATIDPNGIARDIRVIEGIGFGCDKAAVEALKSSRFTPAKKGDTIVSLRIQIPYRFELANWTAN